MLVEWPERIGAETPPGVLTIAMEPLAEEGARRARVSGWDARVAGLGA